MVHFLIGVATLAAGAFVAVAYGFKRPALLILLGFGGVLWTVTSFDVARAWTPTVFVASEGAMAILAALVGLEAARRAGLPVRVTARALLAVLACFAGAVVLQASVPMLALYAYRGLVGADAAVAILLAVILGKRVLEDPLDGAAVAGLVTPFALSSVCLLLQESPHLRELRLGLQDLQKLFWFVAMALITRVAYRAGAAPTRPQSRTPPATPGSAS